VAADFIGDVNSDGQVGLDDAIHALQVVAGNRSQTPVNEDAIYVASTGTNTGGGMLPSDPLQTIAHGITRALEENRSQVLVANGLYIESIDLSAGVDLLGGFNTQFTVRNSGVSYSIIRAAAGNTYTVRAQDITVPTILEGFVIDGPFVALPGMSSAAVQVIDCTAALAITNNTLYAGRGGNGIHGIHGDNGPDGLNGGPGDGSIQTDTADLGVCQALPNTPGQGGNGGVLVHGSVSISGGDGGSAQCPYRNDSQPGGNNGHGPAAGTGGIGGNDVFTTNCQNFSTAGNPQAGSNGTVGQHGVNGARGNGGQNSTGQVIALNYIAESGTSGSDGTPGSGGGGGGAGGGADVSYLCGDVGDATGGAGGGGGSGGAMGSGGTGGGGSGGAFGIFLYFNAVPGGLPDIQSNHIFLGTGGNGGWGGAGGNGGRGGWSGEGGQASGQLAFTMGSGGTGGNGGHGGHGGGGGGAAGGPAYGMLCVGATAPASYSNLNTFDMAHSAAGKGGTGGQSPGESGSTGQDGAIDQVQSMP